MKIIGLTGFAKSGKSTAAEVLREMGGHEVAFAKHLKDVCSLVFSIPRDHFDNQEYKEKTLGFTRTILKDDIQWILEYFEVPKRLWPNAIYKHVGVQLKTPRHTAQYIGTEVLRDIDTEIHVNMAFKLNENSKAQFLICSDVRFHNEWLSITKHGGFLIGISRKAVRPKDLTNLHASEAEVQGMLDGLTYVVNNESTVEEFKNQIATVARGFLK